MCGYVSVRMCVCEHRCIHVPCVHILIHLITVPMFCINDRKHIVIRHQHLFVINTQLYHLAMSRMGEKTYRPTCWLPSEELDVLTAMWGVESRVDERATLCYGFQGPRTLVWEAKTNKHLERKETYRIRRNYRTVRLRNYGPKKTPQLPNPPWTLKDVPR